MTKFVVALVCMFGIGAVGLIVTNESTYMDSHAGQDQFISSLLK